jgi:GT2 family glycosyltransferase
MKNLNREVLDGQIMDRIDNKEIPDNKDEVRMFIVGIDCSSLIPHLLKHHFDIGVDRVFYIDNDSSDDSIDVLLKYDNVHVWRQTAAFSSQHKTDWTEELLRQYGRNRWCLIVDTDEFFIYPDYENTSIREFVKTQENHGYDCVAARFIDMYSNKKVKETLVVDSLIEACPFFDVGGHGCRERVLGFKPDISKMPLFLYGDEVIPTPCFHSIRGFKKLSDVYCGLLHFKFHSNFKSSFLRHLHKMNDADKKERIYRSLDEQNFYDKTESVRFTGSHNLKLFEDFWKSDIWISKISDYREMRDFSYLTKSIKYLDEAKDTCVVIIGCYNEFAITKQLIDSLLEHRDDTYNYIYLFFDDSSEELDTLHYFQENIDQIDLNLVFGRYIRNRGLTSSWNNGVNIGRANFNAKYFLLLNNDIIVTPDWARKLMDFARNKGDECAVGPITNHCNTRSGKQNLVHYLEKYSDIRKSDIPQVCRSLRLRSIWSKFSWKQYFMPQRIDPNDFLSGFCLLLPAKVLEDSYYSKEGAYTYYFNPSRLHYGNEMEFFARFRYPLYVLPEVFVYHEGEASIRSFKSRFGFLYSDNKVNRELVMLVIHYFWAEDDEKRKSECLRKIEDYLRENPCDELRELIRDNSRELDSDVRILRRQQKFET